VMAWIMDTISMHRGHTVPAVVTGKPINIGGSFGRHEAPARGLVYILREASEDPSFPISGAKIIIQGFGKAGLTSAQVLSEMGATIVGVSDSQGAIYNRRGLPVSDVLAAKQQNGSVTSFSEADHLTNEELLEQPCDILIPAALAN